MLDFFDGIRGTDFLSVMGKMLIVVACGGIIGMEREYKRRAAGFRTHILICLGAAMTTLTSEYLFVRMGYYTDIGRIGAQVVAGIGFIGAGCIIVTKRSRVKGLTTAAGLWASAIVGLSVGAGFFEGGLVATFFILLAEILFSRLEYKIGSRAYETTIYIEYESRQILDNVLRNIKQMNIRIDNLEITRKTEGEKKSSHATFTMRPRKNGDIGSLMIMASSMDGVINVEEV